MNFGRMKGFENDAELRIKHFTFVDHSKSHALLSILKLRNPLKKILLTLLQTQKHGIKHTYKLLLLKLDK